MFLKYYGSKILKSKFIAHRNFMEIMPKRATRPHFVDMHTYLITKYDIASFISLFNFSFP